MVILRMVILRKDESEEDEPAHWHGNPGWIPDNDFRLEVAIAVRPLPLSVDGLPADGQMGPKSRRFGRSCGIAVWLTRE